MLIRTSLSWGGRGEGRGTELVDMVLYNSKKDLS